jgi:zinc D-Ala-D-Ala carboxypeptidase
MKLSEHFSLSELTKSSTAERLGIDNEPDDEAKENLIALCNMVLENVRNHYGIPFVPNSGYRCPELNRAIGSSDRSQHVSGQAVDFEVPGISNKDVALWVKDNCDFDQLILEFYKEGDPSSGWVHCSYTLDGSNRKSARIFDGKVWSDL